MAKAKKEAPKTTVRVQQPRRQSAPSSGGRAGPVVIVREAAAKAKRAVRRDTGAGGHQLQRQMQGMALGGFGVGMIEKNFGDRIPTVAMLGRKGTIAAGIYFLKPKEQWLRNVGLAAAAMAGYEFGKEGKVSGGEDDYDDDD